MYLAIKKGIYKGVYKCENYSDVKLLFDKCVFIQNLKYMKIQKDKRLYFGLEEKKILSKLNHIKPNEKTKEFIEIIERAANTGTHVTITFIDGNNTTFFVNDICLINTKNIIKYDNTSINGYKIQSSDSFINPNTFYSYMNEYVDKNVSITKTRKEVIKDYLSLYKKEFEDYPWYTYEASYIGIWGDFVSVESFKELKSTKTKILEKIDIAGNKIFNVNAIRDIHVFGMSILSDDIDFLEVVQKLDRKVS